MSTGIEIEAKYLTSERKVLLAIARRKAIGMYRLSCLPAKMLRTIYLDTADQDLERVAAALRVRRAGGRVEATVKGAGRVRGALHERPEWNVPLERIPRFPWRKLPTALRCRLPKGVRDAAFVPILETRIRRRVIKVTVPASRRLVAEIALDEIEFRLPDSKAVGNGGFEVEIELLPKGERKDLKALGDILQREYSLRPNGLSKLVRGRDWAETFRLEHDVPPSAQI